MEYFEQAHVAKIVESKKEEAVKKQLKQMLYGYKKSDNDLIKSSMNINVDSDDSSSVSGFSDLNLTTSNSSGAGDTTRATIGSPDDVDSILDDLSTDVSPKITDLTLNSDNEEDTGGESFSEDITYLTEDLQLDCDESSSLQSGDDEVSLSSASIRSLVDTESSQEFDPDGLLASKIHQNLKKKITKVTKRKLDTIESNSEDDVPQKIKSVSDVNDVPSQPRVLHPSLIADTIVSESEPVSKKNLTKLPDESPPDVSPPYITLNAADLHQEKFEDVVGKYKHPTIKNIPYDTNKLIFSETDPSFYSAAVMTIDEEDMAEEITDVLSTTIEDDMESSKDIPIEASIENIDDTQSEQSVKINKNNLEDSVKIIFKGNLCICIMKHPAKLYVNGKCKVRCLAGTVEIFGHTLLANKSYEIYAPYTNFAQCLTSVDNVNTYYGLFGQLTKIGFTVPDAEDIVTTLGISDAVLVIQPLKNAKMNFVEEYFSVANLFINSSKRVGSSHAQALQILGCSIYTSPPPKVFEVPVIWQEIKKYCFNEQSRGIFCGGKGVGKSTCLRYHVNRLLAHGPVLVIDLDIGQCEFTVAGNISASVVNEPLLGPNFTHLRKPERTLNLGMINPLDNMRRYVNAVVSLIAYCASDERLRGMRWIVNTMGLCNVVGLHFITIIILHCQPTYLVQIDSKNVKKRFDTFLRPQQVAAHYECHKNNKLFENTSCPDTLNYAFIVSHHTDTPVKNNNTLAARDERYLNFLAYFSELLQIHRSSTLLAVAPYEVQLQDLCVYMNVKIPEGTVQQVLNGKIVALCQHELGSVIEKTHVLANKPLLCHGHGLIRGIDFERGILYVLTPMPIEDLQVVDTLLYADWVPELRGQEACLPPGSRVPYRMPTMYQQKQLMFTPRRRFNPVQLLKMSRGS